jgi:hypothetical protein
MEKKLFEKLTCLQISCPQKHNEFYLCINRDCNRSKIICKDCKIMHDSHQKDVVLLSDYFKHFLNDDLKEKLINSGIWLFDDEKINQIAKNGIEADLKKIDEICMSMFKSIRIVLERMKNEFKQKLLQERLKDIKIILKFYQKNIENLFSSEEVMGLLNDSKNIREDDLDEKKIWTLNLLEKIDLYSSKIKEFDFSFLDKMNEKLSDSNNFNSFNFSDKIIALKQREINTAILDFPSALIANNNSEKASITREMIPKRVVLYKGVHSNHNAFLNSIKIVDNLMFSSDISAKIMIWSFPRMNPIEIINPPFDEKSLNFLKIVPRMNSENEVHKTH